MIEAKLLEVLGPLKVVNTSIKRDFLHELSELPLLKRVVLDWTEQLYKYIFVL